MTGDKNQKYISNASTFDRGGPKIISASFCTIKSPNQHPNTNNWSRHRKSPSHIVSFAIIVYMKLCRCANVFLALGLGHLRTTNTAHNTMGQPLHCSHFSLKQTVACRKNKMFIIDLSIFIIIINCIFILLFSSLPLRQTHAQTNSSTSHILHTQVLCCVFLFCGQTKKKIHKNIQRI